MWPYLRLELCLVPSFVQAGVVEPAKAGLTGPRIVGIGWYGSLQSDAERSGYGCTTADGTGEGGGDWERFSI